MLINKAVKAPSVRVDSDFGEKTELAVIAAQQRLGLVVDGKAGTQTITALKREAEPVKPGRSEPNKSVMNAPAVFTTNAQPLDAYPPRCSTT